MEVILRSDVVKLGKAYEVVQVKDGYARNYLLPKALAFRATKANLEKIKKEKRTKELLIEKDKSKYLTICDNLSGKSYTIPVACNEEERPYASVSAGDIVDAIKLEGLEVGMMNVILDQTIKELGIYEVQIRLKYDIKTKIKIWIVKK